MRYKLLIVALFVAVIAVGCSKSDTKAAADPSTPEVDTPTTPLVAFSAIDNWDGYAQAAAKSELQGGFESGDYFGVLANHVNEGESVATTPPNFMYNQKVVYNGATWSYSPLKYWPNTIGDQVVFYGYLPYSTPDDIYTNCVTLSNSAAAGAPIITYTPNKIAELNTDLCCTQPIVKGLDDQNSPVVFEFNHVLSKITFSIRHNGILRTNDTKNSGDVVTIKYISIKNIKVGNYNMGTESAAASWSYAATPVEFMTVSTQSGGLDEVPIVYLEEDGASFVPISAANSGYFIPPQTIGDGENMTISVNLEIEKSHVEGLPEDEIIKIMATVELIAQSVTVEQGKSYNFQIDMDVKNFIQINLNKVVEQDWVEELIEQGEVE